MGNVMKAWKAGVALVAGSAAAAGLALAKTFGVWPFAPPPGKYRLTVNAVTDSTPIALAVTVDSNSLITGGYLDLDPGNYTITAPGQVVDASGNAYTYTGYE